MINPTATPAIRRVRRVSARGRVTHFLSGEPHAVYRIYDTAGLLLYIGMSSDPEGRVRAHRGTAPWRREISSWTAAWYANRAAAGRAEQAAIDAEMPCHGMTTELYREVSQISRSVGADGRRAAVEGAREQYRRRAIEWQIG